MYQIIAPTLFQNKICRLPGIGTLSMVSHPAENDFINGRINAPVESISFIPEHDEEKGFNEFSAFSELLQKTLDESGSFLLTGIGNFKRTATGEINFTPVSVDPVFIPPVAAEILIRPDASHAMLVGDQETTSVEMTEYFSGKHPSKQLWLVWAAVLAAAGIAALLYYFNKYGWNEFGNVHP